MHGHTTTTGGHAIYTLDLLSALASANPCGELEVSLFTCSDLPARYRTGSYAIHDRLPPMRPVGDFRNPTLWSFYRLWYLYIRERLFIRLITALPALPGGSLPGVHTMADAHALQQAETCGLSPLLYGPWSLPQPIHGRRSKSRFPQMVPRRMEAMRRTVRSHGGFGPSLSGVSWGKIIPPFLSLLTVYPIVWSDREQSAMLRL